MPAPKSPEFRRRALDLVEQGNPVAQVARDLGISESCLRRWMERDDVDAGRKEGLTSAERKIGRQADHLPADAPVLAGEVAFRLHHLAERL